MRPELRLRVFLRSLGLQACWNHQRMQNLGLLGTMLPWLYGLERDEARDRQFCRRYFEFFNTNPYLANYIIGGLIRLEEQRLADPAQDPRLLSTFRDSLGRTFASLGDQLFWLGVRPTLTMGICLLGMHGRSLTILLVVGIFALGQLALRWRALAEGYELGLDIVELLDRSRWHQTIAWAKRLGMFLTGMLTGCYLLRVVDQPALESQAVTWVAVGLGFLLPFFLRKRFPGEGLVLLAFLVACLLGFAL